MLTELEEGEIQEYEHEVKSLAWAEVLENDRIHRTVVYHRFVSKSKGRRTGTKRRSKCLVEYSKSQSAHQRR